ncbi:MAG: glycosyltransferase [Lachnospiraceae bacterium]|nr:glycosyltransferase [Lachnospiraceae bacterium]
MKVLYLNITTFFANRDMLDALEHYRDESGNPLEIIRYPHVYDEKKARNDPDFEREFLAALRKENPDFVFSFNFLPVVSKVCNVDGVCYVSWIYDNPEIFLYSYQVINPCNLVLMFDSKQFETFRKGRINTVEYLPLAASVRRLDSLVPDDETRLKYEAPISFVGSLYTERQQYYDQIAPRISDYHRGYLEGLIEAQLQVNGVNFIEECLPKDLVEDMQKASNLYPYPDSAETLEYLFANYVINRQITIIERKEILSLIGKHFPVRLYTYKQNGEFRPEGVTNMGPADYFEEMPYIFKLSKINLNITLRSIQNAIPLRGYDILGAGGFLLSNYQTDLARHFVPDEEYVYYEDREDMLNKIEYYLSHEDERSAIARNAHDKIAREHTFDVRVGQIIEMVKNKIH